MREKVVQWIYRRFPFDLTGDCQVQPATDGVRISCIINQNDFLATLEKLGTAQADTAFIPHGAASFALIDGKYDHHNVYFMTSRCMVYRRTALEELGGASTILSARRTLSLSRGIICPGGGQPGVRSWNIVIRRSSCRISVNRGRWELRSTACDNVIPQLFGSSCWPTAPAMRRYCCYRSGVFRSRDGSGSALSAGFLTASGGTGNRYMDE